MNAKMTREEFIKKVADCGVVGAGGGGFPTHIKISSPVDWVIANGAECEPLLSTDNLLLYTQAEKIVSALKTVKRITGASNCTLAVKKKHENTVEKLRKIIERDQDVDLFLLRNYYPAGDEVELVYDIAGRRVPAGGIPPDVGTVVLNVNTLYNISNATEGDMPVIRRWITVTGEVENPFMAEVPIGTAVGDIIDRAVPRVRDYTIIAGGPMMGMKAERGLSITKKCSGVLVLPPDNACSVKHSVSSDVLKRRGASVCDQCFDCSIACPRNLLGYDLQPHIIMRNLFVSSSEEAVHVNNALLCSECGLCDMYACPLELSPRKMLAQAKENASLSEIKAMNEIHQERDFRRIDQGRLITRLGLDKYRCDELPVINIETRDVRIDLKQHTGSSAVPVVGKGQKVKTGQLIGEIPQGELGARVHASIDGIISDVNPGSVSISVSQGV